jgi:Domain of unknown function (DUF4399)
LPNLAHTLGAGGPDIEMLLLAVALLFLGVTFFIQKTTKPAVPVVLLVGALGVGAGAFAVGGSAGDQPGSDGVVAAPEGIGISITSPTDSDTVPAGEAVEVTVELTGADLTDATTSEDPTEGHLHIFVDGTIVSMPSTTTNEVELEPGDHTIAVEFTTADHRSFDPRIQDEVTVTAQ